NLKKVFKEILGQSDYVSLDDIPQFNIDDLSSLEQPFSKSELKIFIKELCRTFDLFYQKFRTNKLIACVYINTFIKASVHYVQNHINKSAKLRVKILLDRSRGYGSVDYIVELVRNLVLLYEANSEDINKEAAQVLVQMQSVIEQQLHK
ncbi:4787_t:CDS:1, partial [Gigaspora rosea]